MLAANCCHEMNRKIAPVNYDSFFTGPNGNNNVKKKERKENGIENWDENKMIFIYY